MAIIIASIVTTTHDITTLNYTPPGLTIVNNVILSSNTHTGTPIQNNIPELYSLLNFMHTEEFKDREKFLAHFGTISTDEQVKGLQEILRKCHALLC